MVMDRIDIKKLNLEELNGVVSIYPWYAGARKELCRRMSELGEGAWSEERYAEAALYMGSRSIIAALVTKGKQTYYSDKNIGGIIHSRIVLAGGDFFSQTQYNDVRRSDDNIFSTFAQKAKDEGVEYAEPEDNTDFCTETLAQIYVEQGYWEQAKDIYSKLSLRYPEKSVYFASLIEKINKK